VALAITAMAVALAITAMAEVMAADIIDIDVL
jgi:hypothetical protein